MYFTLQDLISVVKDVENRLKDAKIKYSSALRNLEAISDSIHESRKLRSSILGERGSGVGAEECRNKDIDGQSTSTYHEQLSVGMSMSIKTHCTNILLR